MMMTKYKCFYIEVFDDGARYLYSVYYNGTCCTTGEDLVEEKSLEKAKHWVDDYGYEWLVVE